ncbi:MAG: diaminopimelate epimerase [Bryobacteraceae bacterium]|nr:diaminopimelate epimerase [Bryobacteraceae bacterium]
MTEIPFTKAHGARNDFLLTWASEAPASGHDTIATAICDRNIGPGADGWMLVTPPTADGPATIRLWNSDGSEAEISGNGTRCAAAFLVDAGLLDVDVDILTGAGLKHLRVLERRGKSFVFEMNMGTPKITEPQATLPLQAGGRTGTLLDVGNPQCAVFVDNFAFDWRKVGAEIESHPMFPNRTNVSFVRPVDQHTIDVRFYERGAGVTMSSGTGSTGAAAAAHARGIVSSPVTVLTPAGPLELRWQNEAILLVGPAEIVVTGTFYHNGE